MIITNVEIQEMSGNMLDIYFYYNDRKFRMRIEIINELENKYRTVSEAFFDANGMISFEDIQKNKEYILGNLINKELIGCRRIFDEVEGRYQMIEEIQIEITNEAVKHLLRNDF
ncbi:hypothetical protein [Paenibacillus gallinarum]|uniref:Uncharacterized protein n=1 Tax=Paenibacillus gallinarum TaxID=2762232 RepID=A0ABR8T0C9_9BACL|nr:hypothetical protein [Paenibacillus gallinarum]MBD7969219.1 hypothetical protein [Paenibacillus gallinarum]